MDWQKLSPFARNNLHLGGFGPYVLNVIEHDEHARENEVMRTYFLFLIFFIVGCSSLSSRKPSSEGPEKILLTLDAHVHFQSEAIHRRALENKFLGHSFLISNSYSVKSLKNFSSRLLRDQEVSILASSYPLRISGLCGVNLSWPDAGYILEECLKLPGMVGAKIHDLEETDGLTEKNKFKALQEVLRVMGSRDLVLLWHLKSDAGIEREKLGREIKEIVTSASRHRNIFFILAHAVDSLDTTQNLEMVVGAMKLLKMRPENLFIDLSATMDICEDEPPEEKIRLWRAFGLDYVLLGSDSSLRSWPAQVLLEEELSVIKNSSIPDSDKAKVFIHNGLKILKKVNSPAYENIQMKLSENPFDLKEVKSHTCESIKDLVQTYSNN